MQINPKQYVVYRHIFPNGKSYIGITSQPIEKRWQNGRGYSKQSKVFHAIHKYGWENIRHEILAHNLSLDEANCIEMEMIEKFNAVSNGYNISIGGGGTQGIPCSASTKAKISKANTGRPNIHGAKNLNTYRREHGAWNKGGHLTAEQYRKISEERKRRCNKEIWAYDPITFQRVAVYESSTRAASALGVSKAVISRAALGKRKTSCGFIWRYADDIRQCDNHP